MKAAKLAALTSQVRTGGKGSVRRKKKAIHRSAGVDDKRLQATLQRLPGYNQLQQIEEVNFFLEDGNVIHVTTPKVSASMDARTFCVSGKAETKKLQELLPGILPQLGIEGLLKMKDILGPAPTAAAETKPEAEAEAKPEEKKPEEAEKKPEAEAEKPKEPEPEKPKEPEPEKPKEPEPEKK
jgi:nascent polypeptide-associated complex subunit beta